jgi:glyoxylase I family protein
MRLHTMPARLLAAIPKLASLDIERSQAFFERLGFERRGAFPDYGIVERDGVQLHFWLCDDPRIPRETACRIAVDGIETLYEAFAALGVIHPNGRLEAKPWGVLEFSVLDPDRNLVTFQQPAGSRMFKRIDHIELLTPAPERTIAFYVDVLGFRERDRVHIPETPQGPLDLVYLDLGGTTVEVMCYPQAPPIPTRAAEQRLGWQCLALEVEDMDAAVALLRQKAVAISWGPLKRADYARAEIRDPDGNPIELRQWFRR